MFSYFSVLCGTVQINLKFPGPGIWKWKWSWNVSAILSAEEMKVSRKMSCCCCSKKSVRRRKSEQVASVSVTHEFDVELDNVSVQKATRPWTKTSNGQLLTRPQTISSHLSSSTIKRARAITSQKMRVYKTWCCLPWRKRVAKNDKNHLCKIRGMNKYTRKRLSVEMSLFISKKQDKRVKVNVVRRIEHNGSDTSVI